MSDATYDNKTAEYFEDRREEMLPFVPEHAKRILEIGCGNAAFAANLRKLRQVNVTAIESHEPAARIAARRVDRVLQGSLEESIEKLRTERFDCVVLNDVLEHLVDPWDALRRLKELLSAGGVVVASIPNIRYLPVFKEFVLYGGWHYQRDGVLDRTHLRFFTKRSVQDLFETVGLRVKQVEGINATDFAWKFALFNSLLGHRFDDTRFKQFACVAGVE